MNSNSSYLDLYKEFEKTIREKSASPLNNARAEAFSFYEKNGLQTTKNEAYKYSDVSSWFDFNYGMNLNRVPMRMSASELVKCDVSGINSHLFFVINDTFYCLEKSLENLEALRQEGVLVGSLHEYALSHPELVAKYYNTIAAKDDSYVSLNTAFAQDGFFLYVPKGVKISKPIQLIFVMHANVPMMANPRNLIIVEEDAQAQVLVCGHTANDLEFLSNRVTEVYVGRNAIYDHYKLESTNDKSHAVGSLYIQQMAGSNVLVNDITLHNGETRNNVVINLEEEHCETLLCGMAVADGKKHVDNDTLINHKVANCKSRQLYKYVLNDSSTGVFSGKVYVAPNAQKTEAYQVDRNVCMTPEARMFTRPQLEIYADDVKCSHGASTGQMDDTALFYLRSRGIPEAEAKMLLMYAFVNDVVENVRIPALKDKIKSLVENRFRGEQPKCAGCNVCK